MKLKEKEIQKRLQDYENLKRCHTELKKRHEKLKKEVKVLREENKEIRQENQKLNNDVQNLKLEIEELKQIIFGKKKNKKDKDDTPTLQCLKHAKKGTKRNKASYQRKKPTPEEITETKEHHIENCLDCGKKLIRKKIVIFYEEDVPLPDNTTQIKKVIEHQVEKGWCSKCKKWHTAIEIPSKKVIIGNKVRIYICYLSILLRISYPQIQKLLKDAYSFEISLGEIANTIEDIGKKLRPEFERIKKKLQEGRGVHMDETGWGKLYLWIMASMDGKEVLYLAGKNRGNGHIDDLLGENYSGIRINDAYPAYKNKAGICQQCWAHPHRKMRDLACSKILTKDVREHCYEAYQEFSAIYTKLRDCIVEPFNVEKRAKQKSELWESIKLFRQPNSKDPKKLKNLRKQFYTYEDEWLNCMDYEGVPCDNNKAERELRHFVIKRKISFGTRNEKTSRIFETLATVFMTFWKKTEKNFFSEIAYLFI